MANIFPVNREDVGIKVFPHGDNIKRGDPTYYHYAASESKFGDKFKQKIDTSPRVTVIRHDFSPSGGSGKTGGTSRTSGESPLSSHVTHGTHTHTESHTQHEHNDRIERPHQLNAAIEDHLLHHKKLEKLDDFNLDVTPSPDSSMLHQQHNVSDLIHEVETTREHEYDEVPNEHQGEIGSVDHSFGSGKEHGKEDEHAHHDAHSMQHHIEHHIEKMYGTEGADFKREHQHETHQHGNAEPDIRFTEEDEDGYEVVPEIHTTTQRDEVKRDSFPEPQFDHVQHSLIKEYGDTVVPEEEVSVKHHIEEYEEKHPGHEHHDEHSMQHHIEHHEIKRGGEQKHPGHEHHDEHSMQHHIEHHEMKHGGEQKHPGHEHHDEHSMQHHVEHHKMKQHDENLVEPVFMQSQPKTGHVEPSVLRYQEGGHTQHDAHTPQHHVQHHIEKYGGSGDQHKHHDQHTIEHHVEHHKTKYGDGGPQQGHPEYSVERRTEHHVTAPPQQQQEYPEYSIERRIEHNVPQQEQEPDFLEHHPDYRKVKQMVEEVERKHQDEHSTQHHIEHHKAKQQQQQHRHSSYQFSSEEPTLQLIHERHEVRLNIEVKPQQRSSYVEPSYEQQTRRHVEPSYVEPQTRRHIETSYIEPQTKRHVETSYTEPHTNTVYMELQQDQQASPTHRRIEAQYPQIDSPTKVKTDAIIAQLKSVGVDAGGVKSLKDLKEEKKLAQYRKEEEVKAEIERMKREYTAEKFMNTAPTHGGKSGFELPEWKRKQIAQKKAEEAAKMEEARLWKEFEEWKQSQSPGWVKELKQRKT